MRDRPAGVGERDVRWALAEGWGIEAVAMEYAAVGAGVITGLRHLLAEFDRMASRIAAAPDPVITHGEPHPANIIRSGGRAMLIDWDTVGLGPPERDLWMMAGGLDRYTAVTGRAVDPGALAFYRLRWVLDDISAFVTRLRPAHHRTPDAEHAWWGLQVTVGGTTARSG